MKRIVLVTFLLMNILFTEVVRATVMDLNLLYFTDSLSTNETTSYGATFYNLFLGLNLNRDGSYQMGWNYSNHLTESKESGVNVSYKTTQMGPGFIAYLDKKKAFRLGVSYNLVTTGSHQRSGEAKEDWRGTAINADIGYQIRFESRMSLGLRLNYSSASYVESRQNSTVEDISHKKNLIYPSVALTFEL